MPAEKQWYKIENENEVFSPSLLVYRDRIESNIRKMAAMAGDVTRLRPHVKTHKMPEIMRLQMNHGIFKFKCATIAEAEMAARCGSMDILLAMQPVGPNIERFFRLKQAFLDVNISCIADSEQILIQLSEMACQYNNETHIWIDINVGMNRTGIVPGEEAIRLYKITDNLPKLKAVGFHVYDGHIHEKVFALREQICNDAFAPVLKMVEDLKRSGFTQVRIVVGGTPTFPIHATRKDVEISPGTVLLWDFGYSSSFADMDFQHAAVLFTRVVSKPDKDLICLDLGHKAVASEMPQPRIKILGIDDYTIIGHNEEHMVIKTSYAGHLEPGDPVYAIPWHICPTVDRFETVYVVTESGVTGQWNVEARKRQITF
jgi:D-serine deaminase-like pyridoxal phosphate-dependent protein